MAFFLILTLYLYCCDLLFKYNSSASNRIIPAKDHASIQINLAEIDSSTGRITGNHKILTISGAIRRMVSILSRIYLFINRHLCCNNMLLKT